MIDGLPDLNGAVVTLDALHSIEATFDVIVERKNGDVLVCVKDNAKALKRRIIEKFSEDGRDADCFTTNGKEHGRVERRHIRVLSTTPVEMKWAHAHVVCEVTRDIKYVRDGDVFKTSNELVYYVGTMSLQQYSAENILALTRGHWGIETGLHHRKDRSMDEDRNRAGRKGAGRIMCFLRSMAALIFEKSSNSTNVARARLCAKLSSLISFLKSCSPMEWMRRSEAFLMK